MIPCKRREFGGGSWETVTDLLCRFLGSMCMACSRQPQAKLKPAPEAEARAQKRRGLLSPLFGDGDGR